MRIALTSIILLGQICSCSIPADVKLFNNSGEVVIVRSGDKLIRVEPSRVEKITAVFRRDFSIEIADAPYQYELEDWPGEYEYNTGWGPFTKRVLMLQINSDGRIWVVGKGDKRPLPETMSQPNGFPLEPRETAVLSDS